MALPDRFRTATFEGYEAGTPSQAKALRATRQFVWKARQPPSWTTRLKQLLGRANSSRPNGLYLVGPAGTGKTHLMAAAYNALTPEVSCVFLHSSTLFRQTAPPDAFAHRIADEHAVCCLDEVEIDDPANEMRLVQVLQTLADRGVPLLATSNVAPEQYLSHQFSETRFERFLHREFREDYRILFVEGPDYRRTQEVEQSGHGWIGPSDQTQHVLRRAHENATGSSRWWTFSDLRRATTETAHPTLIDELTALDHLFIADIAITNTDDALRFLRVIDALYLNRNAPALHFTAKHPPDAWFDPDAHAGVAQAVAEKFERTVSRLHALCDVRPIESVDRPVSDTAPEHKA